MRQITEIIIHCSATREGQDISVDTIKKWHIDGRGWSDIGYHFYIDINGEIQKGREGLPWYKNPAFKGTVRF